MGKINITIKENNLSDAIRVAGQIPEFEKITSGEESKNRLKDIQSLVLTAYLNKRPAGFKIGYAMPSKLNFYSWLGGVLPAYRKYGIAEQLLVYQEHWALKIGYRRILVKTQVKYQTMIKMLQKHGYYRIGVIPFDPENETRLLYEKKL